MEENHSQRTMSVERISVLHVDLLYLSDLPIEGQNGERSLQRKGMQELEQEHR